MNLNETKKLMAQAAAIDNRKLTEETALAWYGLLSHIPFDIAQHALKLAQSDSTISYLEPKHIIGWAKEAAFRLDREKPQQEQKINSTAQPKCKHGYLLLECLPCCRELKPMADEPAAKVLAWAKQNVLAKP